MAKIFTKQNAGLIIAGAGLGLWAVDKATIPTGSAATDTIGQPGSYGGKIYGAGGILNPLTAWPIDPTVLFVVVGLGLWAWQRFGK